MKAELKDNPNCISSWGLEIPPCLATLKFFFEKLENKLKASSGTRLYGAEIYTKVFLLICYRAQILLPRLSSASVDKDLSRLP